MSDNQRPAVNADYSFWGKSSLYDIAFQHNLLSLSLPLVSLQEYIQRLAICSCMPCWYMVRKVSNEMHFFPC